MLNAMILAAMVLTGGLLLWPRLATATLWRATITPLASIIGSGFLVLGPILDVSYGAFAPLAMAGLCALAWAFGGAVRFNIAALDRGAEDPPLARRLEAASSAALAFAFVVSVAYYLNLFGAFGVSLTPLNDGFHADLLTTAVFVVILLTGWLRGFSALERLEQVSVGLKLAIIAGLVAGLALYFGDAAREGALMARPAQVTGWGAATLMAGLIVTVQGFETVRYLGAAYDAPTRIRAMKLAQLISAAIYITYIVLLTYAFDTDPEALSETAIIDMMQVVAPILPPLLVLAALSAQFSAAIADTSGSGGLMAELTGGRLSQRQAYGVLVGAGLLLTWTADVYQIISYASRAFAGYYALQAGIAAIRARGEGLRGRAAWYGGLAALGLAIAGFGAPVE
ncbi:hypothetical protein ACQ5SO_13135 [Rhodovulum sp. DZ06]|uniref:hypothetical protein n=1 Tax=Rhodovulum sp. DZ06 TaxID=3425126 RepID=UPI003D333EDC